MASLFGVSARGARAALRASSVVQESFICKRCLQHQVKTTSQQSSSSTRRQSPFLTAFRQPRQTQISFRNQSSARTAPTTLGLMSEQIANPREASNASTAAGKTSSWPATSSPSVAYWLLGSAVSVFGIVIFGGLTRLTESGLSITEWRPVTGSFPPRNEEIWEEEFARYKLSPEFKMLNSRMNLEEFKQIYWMEWIHRLWGRVVGITFLVPTVYFVARRRVSSGMAMKLVGICGLIGFQGFIGWWMVKSGLKDDLLETGTHPRVSQYRLAAHLGTAFVAYLAMLWNGLQIIRENALVRNPHESLQMLQRLQSPELRNFKRLVAGLSALVFITAMSGALVAGLDAGLIYNNFPWMGQGLLPPTREMLDPFYSHTQDQGDLLWRNMLENPVLVQLDHRILATTTFTAILGLWAYSRFSSPVRTRLPKGAHKGMLGVVHLVTLQVVLGISTLWYLVPTPVASAHQAGALALLTGVFVLCNRVFVPRRTLQLVQNAVNHAQSVTARRGPDAMMQAKMAGVLAPHEVPSRANIAALRSLGVRTIIAFSAVGSLREEIKPRDFVIPDQVIDRTKGVRPFTFFEGGMVGHVGFADPFSPALAALVQRSGAAALAGEGVVLHERGTIVCMEGPQFSTRAESQLYRQWGGSVINMSALPEAKLAREAELAYQMICMSTDYDCWHQSAGDVTVEMVMGNMKANAENARRFVGAVLDELSKEEHRDLVLAKDLEGQSKFAGSITAPAGRTDEAKKKLAWLFPSYFD
nr:cytochrome c oxidase assembly protein cox15 [Quercus suber]